MSTKDDKEGFPLKTASRLLRKTAALMGVKSGRWSPVGNQNYTMGNPDRVIAKVWNSRKSISVTAGDMRYVQQYLD